MEMGESLVAAYFKYVEGIRMVVHNAPFDQGQGEIDLVAINPAKHQVYLCEVATHIQGLLYGNGYDDTRDRIREKLIRARQFAQTQFPRWEHHVMFWSPVVPPGLADKLFKLEAELDRLFNLKEEPDHQRCRTSIVINKLYAEYIVRVQEKARTDPSATDESAFRVLQILERLKRA